MKPALFELRKKEVELMSSTKRLQRNFLGFLYKKDINVFIPAFIQACQEHGEKVSQTFKYKDEIRLVFEDSPLTQEIVLLNEKPTYEVGVFFKEPVLESDEKQMIRDTERLMMVVYFNINNRALTHFRKFLLENILDIQKEVVGDKSELNRP